MQFQADGKPIGGPVDDLVCWLIEKNTDKNHLHVFFATFPQVTTAMRVWELVMEKFNAAVPPAAAEKIEDTNSTEKLNSELRERTIQFVWAWIECDFARDFLSRSVSLFEPLMKDFLPRLSTETANMIKLLMIRVGNKRKRMNRRMMKLRTTSKENASEDVINSAPPSPSNRKTSDSSSPLPPLQRLPMKVQGGGASSGGANLMARATALKGEVKKEKNPLEAGKFEFGDLEPESVAEQLTVIEQDMFSRIKDTEFLNMNWKSEDKEARKASANILGLVGRFNSVSYWVGTEIVMQTELKKRVNVLRKFISVAEHLEAMGNFNGVMEIIGGLNLFAVSRLKATWEQISAAQKKKVEDLNVLMESIQNYKNYRNALKTAKLPVLPYLGVYLRDITFIDEGNPNYLDGTKKIVSFEKLCLVGDILNQIKYYQEEPYDLDPDPALQEFLRKVQILPEEMLYKHSLLCEASDGTKGQ